MVPDTTGSAPSVDGLIAFFDHANAALQLALVTVIAWPLAALCAAMFLHGKWAQTVVPIVDMLPLLAVFFVVIGAPFGLLMLLRDPTARKGFSFLAALIGIELVIGFYLSTVPVSNDNGLVPMLLLGAMALFFLWVAKFAKPLQVALGLGLVVITIIFIVGGRAAFKKEFSTVSKLDYSLQSFETATIPLSSDSWSKEVTLPAYWSRDGATYILAVNRDFDDADPATPWFAFRCAGAAGELIDTGTVYKAGMPYHSGLFSSCSGAIQFRGHADMVFNRVPGIAPTVAETPVPSAEPVAPTPLHDAVPEPTVSSPPPHTNAAVEALVAQQSANPAPQPARTPLPATPVEVTPPPPPKPVPLRPDWTNRQKVEVDDFIVEAAPCILSDTTLHCYVRITNQTDHDLQVDLNNWAGPIRIIDDQGVEYKPYSIQVGNTRSANWIDPMLPPGVPIAGFLNYRNFSGNLVNLLEFPIHTFNGANHPVLFRNLSVTKAPQ